MSQKFTNSQISKWVSVSIKNEDIENYKSEVVGSSEKGEGYATDVVFVKVTGSKKTNAETTELNLVLKVGKDFEALKSFQTDEGYQKEMYLYNRVLPEYKKYEEEKKIRNIFNSIPRCLKTLNDEKQIIVFENLRTQGYEEYDRLLPMNIDHMKIILKNYAKFHSIGFAFKDQKPSEFGNLIKNYSCGYKSMLDGAFRSVFQTKATAARNVIGEIDEHLAKKVDVILQKNVVEILDELVLEKTVEESVITHGDCWNSNFLFKYENGNKECPSEAAILDWQISSYISPLIDLAYFMFIVSSKEQVSQFNDLLDYYYENLSKNITELGSDPNKLFPRSKFLEHWRCYSTVGYIFVLSFLDFFLCDKSEAPDVGECKSEEDLIKVTENTTAKDKEMYAERLLAVTRYYFDLVDK